MPNKKNHVEGKGNRSAKIKESAVQEKKSQPPAGQLELVEYAGCFVSPVDLAAKPLGPNMEGWDKNTQGPKEVLLSFFLNDIIDVDTVNENWRPSLAFCFDYVDDGALVKGDLDDNYWSDGYTAKDPNADDRWGVFPMLMNTVETDGKPNEETTGIYLLHGRPVYTLYQTYKTFLRSHMDLREFPFDVQSLSVVLTSNMWLSSDIKFVVENNDPFELANICVDERVAENGEYKLLAVNTRTYEHKYSYLSRYDRQKEGYPEVVIDFVVARRPQYYIYNVILPMAVILVVAALAFFIDPSDAATRFAISTTMLLTNVAFHFVVSSNLPKVPYNTRFDTWIAINYLLLLFLNVENVVMYRVQSAALLDDATLFKIDLAVLGGYVFILIISTTHLMMPYFTKSTIDAAIKKV